MNFMGTCRVKFNLCKLRFISIKTRLNTKAVSEIGTAVYYRSEDEFGVVNVFQ